MSVRELKRLFSLPVFLTIFYCESGSAVIYCDNVKSNPSQFFEKQSRYGDITPYLDVFKQICHFDARKAIPESKLKQLEKTGYTMQLGHHMDRLQAYSTYGAVDKNDYESAKKYAQLLKQDYSSLIESFKATGDKQAVNNPRDCSSVDLRPKMGPIRNQDTVGWCHAFVASDLLSVKTGKRISAASLAVHSENYYKAMAKKPRPESEILNMGGFKDRTIVTGLEKGLCLEKDFPSELFGNGDLDSSTLQNFLKTSEHKADLASGAARLYLEPYQVESPLVVCNQNPGNLFSMQHQQTLKNLSEAVIKDSTADTVFTKMESKACEGKRFFPQSISVKSFSSEPTYKQNEKLFPKEELVSKIDEQLKKGTPLGVGYYSGFLSEKNSKRQGGHASIIVGRLFNPESGQCEYLVRNSWGSGCEGMSHKEYHCENGHFWISRGELHRHLINVSYLE